MLTYGRAGRARLYILDFVCCTRVRPGKSQVYHLLYLLYKYKSSNIDAADSHYWISYFAHECGQVNPKFTTCFTSTREQILTLPPRLSQYLYRSLLAFLEQKKYKGLLFRACLKVLVYEALRY